MKKGYMLSQMKSLNMIRINTLYIIIVLLIFGASQKIQAQWNDSQDSIKAYDHVPFASYELIEDRLSCIEGDIPLHLNNRVKAFIDYFVVKDREYTRAVISKTPLYFPLFEKYLATYDLPRELKYLSIVESGLNTQAISRAGAVGLWQFMSGTGRIYKLQHDFYYDDRMDPEKATEAACKYLKWLYEYFDDWELALASYNAGPGNVRKAIRRSGYKDGFWEIYRYLPRETRSYVPQFVAITYALNYAEEHNLIPPAYEELAESDTLIINQFLHLETLANQLGLCKEDLEKLNPSLKHGAVPEHYKNFVLRVPKDLVDSVRISRTTILDSASRFGHEEMKYLARNTIGSTYGREKMVHIVRSGDVLGTIAEKYSVRVSDIRTWNNLYGNLIRVGQRLDIYVDPGYKVPTTTASNGNLDLPDSKMYRVRYGDTLWSISNAFKGVTIEELKTLNNLKSNKIYPGQVLKLGS